MSSPLLESLLARDVRTLRRHDIARVVRELNTDREYLTPYFDIPEVRRELQRIHDDLDVCQELRRQIGL